MAQVARRISGSTTLLRSYPILSVLLQRITVGSIVKLLLGLLMALNIRAFPLVWHFRAIRPVLYAGINYQILRIRHLFSDQRVKEIALENWMDSITPIGSHPFQYSISFRSFASIDESDYNLHMSNSSYAKAMDCVNLKATMSLFPQFLRVGGLIRLAETHFQFVQEIPILANYEIRLTIGAWDEKWLLVVGRFVSKKKQEKKKESSSPSNSSSASSDSHPPSPPARPPRVPTPSPTTLFNPRITRKGEYSLRTPDPEEMGRKTDLKALAAKMLSSEEPDGAVLHTVTLTRICFKLGRITVPPAIILATNGLSRPPPPTLGAMSNPSKAVYSHANPPPHWSIVKSIASKPSGGSLKAMQHFYRGGWKTVPEGERWWEQALGGPVEQQRRERLEKLSSVEHGMNAAREMRSGFGAKVTF
ncbi:hypothetical protein D9758_009633 [Tetrapyrgos nigripes]|uniref:Uncharacterized protein n=1 Tax=Tetrapyrgos nigripes TaxID=182062 RepID=A0A8H5GD83_9AGAR|nr:hypothetical protein D9758_009633 [Tetrapyrgos nigripes]